MESTMQVQVVVAMTEPSGIAVQNPRTVGLCLSPEGDYIVGAIPHTPAAKWVEEDPQAVSKYVGIPWHPNPQVFEETGLTFAMDTRFPNNLGLIDGSLSPRPLRFQRSRRRPGRRRK